MQSNHGDKIGNWAFFFCPTYTRQIEPHLSGFKNLTGVRSE